MWGAGISATLLLAYYRFVLPRLARSAVARKSLKSHQRDLLTKLTSSLQDFRGKQLETFATLPAPIVSEETFRFSSCTTVEELLSASNRFQNVPEISLLRCALYELGSKNPGPSTAELFQFLFDNVPWLEENVAYQEQLWNALNESPRFRNAAETESDPAHWSYISPPLPDPSPSVLSLEKLRASISASRTESSPRYQHGLQTLANFTGYLTAETYSLSGRSLRIPGTNTTSPSSQEDEVRKEIRALKGLVLNRKTFLPPKSSATSP